MKHGVDAGFSDRVKNAAAGALYQAVQIASVTGGAVENTRIVQRSGQRFGSTRPGDKGVQHFEIPGCIQQENHTTLAAGVAAALCHAANVAVHVADQAAGGTGAVSATGEGMKNIKMVRGVEFEYSSEVAGARDGDSVEIAGRVA